MKKISCIVLLIISILFVFIQNVSAYSTNQYSISTPIGYKNAGEGNFSDGEGHFYNVNITYVGYIEDFKYSEENLEILSNELEKVRHQLLDNCNS